VQTPKNELLGELIFTAITR